MKQKATILSKEELEREYSVSSEAAEKISEKEKHSQREFQEKCKRRCEDLRESFRQQEMFQDAQKLLVKRKKRK